MARKADKLTKADAASPALETTAAPVDASVTMVDGSGAAGETPAKSRRGPKPREAIVDATFEAKPADPVAGPPIAEEAPAFAEPLVAELIAAEPIVGEPEVAAVAPPAEVEAVEETPAPVVRRPVGRPRRVPLATPVAKPAIKKIAPKVAVAKASAAKAILRKASAPAAPAKTITKPAPINTAPIEPSGAGLPALTKLKEKLMTQTTDFIAPFQTAISEIQDKAKTAYEKSTEALTEANDFAKGNVEALVESSKIFASGLQELGTAAVAETRSAFEALTADVKELASVKSPTEFFQLQSTLVRKSFDSIVAQASKSSEAMLKLANDVASPLSSRVSLAVEKAGKVA